MSLVEREDQGMIRPLFEPLEERLLLTTLYGGDTFLYYNSKHEEVLITLNVAADEEREDAAIEVWCYDDAWGGVHDLVGLLNYTELVIWHIGEGEDEITEPILNDEGEWLAGSGEVRGAEVEIHAIYFAEWTENTNLTITTLDDDGVPLVWDSTTLPDILHFPPDPEITAPDGSGGVIVGAYRSPTESKPVRHMPWTYVYEGFLPFIEMPWGVYPGGTLSPGISFHNEHLTYETMELPVGANVHSVAVDSTGTLYVVDSSSFVGVVMNPPEESLSEGQDDGAMGWTVLSLVSDSAGTFYAVDNWPDGIIGSPTDQIIGKDIHAIAVDDAGVFYAVDEHFHHLVSWDAANGFQIIGELIDATEPQFRYQDVFSLDFNPADGLLYGLGSIEDLDPTTDPEAPIRGWQFLITIDTTDGSVTSRVLANYGAGTFGSLAFAADGTCYATINENSMLVTIDTTTGVATEVGVLVDVDYLEAVLDVVGIDFIGDSLYGVVPDIGLGLYFWYRIDTTNGVCTFVKDSFLFDEMGSLAYDATRPGGMFTAIDQDEEGYVLTRIPLGGFLVSVDSDGVVTPLEVLVDSVEDTWVWDDVVALDYNDSDGLLYALATAVDLDPLDGSDPPEGLHLVTIDQLTGRVTDLGEVTGVENLNSLASDSTGSFYGIDTGPLPIVGSPTDQSFGTSAWTLAADDTGVFYIIDETTHHLVSWDETGGYQDIGELIDSAEPQFTYEGLTAMDFNTFDGGLFAIGYVLDTDPATDPEAPDPNGPFLIMIDTATGSVTSSVLLNAGVGTFSGMAFFAEDGTCYATLDIVDETSTLVTIDTGTGAITEVGELLEGEDPVEGIIGIDFVGPWLFGSTIEALYLIDPLDGACFYFASIDLPTMGSLTYDPTRPGSLYTTSTEAGGDYLLTRIPLGPSLLAIDASGATTLVDVLFDWEEPDAWVWTSISALDYMESTDAFYSIAWAFDLDPLDDIDAPTGPRLVRIDQATGIVADIGELTGAIDINSLAFDASHPGVLWSTTYTYREIDWYRLTRIDLGAVLVESNGTDTVTRVGVLFDSAEPAFTYVDVHALEFDSGDLLYGVGTIINLDPANVVDPDPLGPYLITIDTATGTATRVAADMPLGVEDMTSLAYDAENDILYGVAPGGAGGDLFYIVATDLAMAGKAIEPPWRLVLDDMYATPITGVVGLDFQDGVLYAVTNHWLYTVDPLTAICTRVLWLPYATVSGLSGDDTQTLHLWATEEEELSGWYYLVNLDLEIEELPEGNYIDRIMVAGTIAGDVDVPRSIAVLEMGFFWGNLTVGRNMDAVIMRCGGGAIWVEKFKRHYMPVRDEGAFSRITVGRTLNGVYSRDGGSELDTLYTSIQVENEPIYALAVGDIDEHESATTREDDVPYFVWLSGEMTFQWNDTPATAQFLNHPSGEFSLTGGFKVVDLETGDTDDWYALPMLAGQTVVVDGIVTNCEVILTDWDGHWMDSFGYETIEDEAVASRGDRLKPMTFTAPSAGIYYLDIRRRPNWYWGEYYLNFSGGTAAALGGLEVDASYHALFTGTGTAADASIATKLGGNLGGVSISESSYFTDVHTIKGGDLVAFQAGEIGTLWRGAYATNTFISDSNIGRIASMTGFIKADIQAGAQGGFYNPDAFIQNIYSASDYGDKKRPSDISATGSIGVIEIKGDLVYGVRFAVNSNDTNYSPNMGSRLDLLDIGGDYYAFDWYRTPMLSHGPGGDIGFIHVAGSIMEMCGDEWVIMGHTTENSGPREGAEEWTITLNDDGGGRMVVHGAAVQEVDDEGSLVYDDYGRPVMADPPSYSYLYIPVEDYIGGVGGAIANFRVDGSARFTTQGTVQIGDLDLTGTGEYTDLIFGGSGRADIYYVHDATFNSLINNTVGTLVSGSLVDVGKLKIHGSIGSFEGTTGAWIHGFEDAPVLELEDIVTEPQYGWFHGKINGLNVSGDIDRLIVDGSLGDLRVEGGVRSITVDADNYTPAWQWHGVRGIIWSGDEVLDVDWDAEGDESFEDWLDPNAFVGGIGSIDVGDGLADDGGGEAARAAIMSSFRIGRVTISGPRFAVNGQVFGELNGAIIAMTNLIRLAEETIDDVVVFSGETTYDAIGKVTGTKGARLTALVLGAQLDAFQCFTSSVLNTGGVGKVSFTGAGAEISGSEISGLYIRKVSTSADSNGISGLYMTAMVPLDNGVGIGEVLAGGPGLNRGNLTVQGGKIKTVRGVGPVADIRNSIFTVTSGGMDYLGARHLVNIGLHVPGTVGTISATGDLRDFTPGLYEDENKGVFVGDIDTVTVGGDFENNTFIVARRIRSIKIGGSFIDSFLSLNGPSVADLNSLIVGGDISGTILSAGRIGSIVAKTGGISADISTIVRDWSGDIGLIETAQGYTGGLDVAGSLKRFISHVSLGNNPVVASPSPAFNIWGDLDYLKVGSSSVTANLFTDINVGGDIGTIDIDGTFYSDVFANGSMTKLVVEGGLGGSLTLLEGWTGADGNGWDHRWSFAGDVDELAANDIQGNRGRVIGDTGATGSVIAYTDNFARDVDQSVLFNISADGMGFGMFTRRLDSNSDTYYLARVVAGGAAGDSLRIYKVVDGVTTELADTGLLYSTAGTDYEMRFTCTSSGSVTVLRVKMWDASGVEPVAWAAQVSDDESALQGIRGRFGPYYDLSDVAFTLTDSYSATFSSASLTVLGSIKSMKFSTTSDLLADLTVGGSIKKIALTGCSIVGNLVSRYGSIGRISVRGGSINGNVQAVSLGKIDVRDGSITGDVTTTGGGIKSLSIRGGNLDGSVTAHNGRIDRVTINGGSVLAGNTLEADGGFGKVSISGGSLLGDLISGGNIKSLSVKGGNIGSAAANVLISAEAGILKLQSDGAIINSTVRSGSRIDNLKVSAIRDSIISAAWNIGSIKISGNVTGSHLLAGFDVGPDGAIGGGDAVHSGNIKGLSIGGLLDSSVVAAGIDPVDGDFTTLGDNVDAPGVSSIYRMTVKGATAGSVILADTYIDPSAPAGAVVAPTRGTVVGTGVDFGPETGGTTLVVAGLTLTLSGAGMGNYNAATNHLVLNRTTTRSKLTLSNTGANVTVTITGSDDSELGGLQTGGAVTLDDMTVHGMIKKLTPAAVADGATWELFGGVSSAKLGNLTNVDITAGELGRWNMGTLTGGSVTADAFKSFTTAGAVTGDLTATLGEIGQINVRSGNLSGSVTAHGTIKKLTVAGSVNGTVTVTNGDLQTLKVAGSVAGVVEATYGTSKSVMIGGNLSGSFRTGMGIKRFTSGSLSGLLSVDGDLGGLTVRGAITGRVRSGGSIKTAKFGSMNGALVFAAGDLRTLRVTGNMTDSYVFAGFDPGDAGYIAGETANVGIDAFDTPIVLPDQVDEPLGGSIKTVRIGGNMTDSTISAGVGPGEDGYVGTDDDITAGIGYVGKVRVGGGIVGNAVESCGIFAASELPIAYHWGNHQFALNGTAHVGTTSTAAGTLTVTEVKVFFSSIVVYFNHPVNSSTLGTVYTGMNPESFTLMLSEDGHFDPAIDTVVSETIAHTFAYNSTDYSATLMLNSATWVSLDLGTYFQLTLDGSMITDSRGVLLDGEYDGSLPSGDREPSGDFIYVGLIGEAVDTFDEVDDVPVLPFVLDEGTSWLASTFEFAGDVDIFQFTGTEYEYFSVEYIGTNATWAEMGVFFRDDQGTADDIDDTFETLARWEWSEMPGDGIFEAFELPGTGEYFVAVSAMMGGGSYQLGATMSSSDTRLVYDLGGALPDDEMIAYISNTIGENNNNLGANDPKQLVYLDFDGGTATRYFDEYGDMVEVEAFDLAYVDISVDGYEDAMINGSADVTGIVENVLSIYQNTPATHSLGALTVELIDVSNAADWATYQAATEGLWFTTVDPAVAQGLDPEADFTTVFTGKVNTWIFGAGPGLIGIASNIDVANQEKGDNALVFAQNVHLYTPYVSSTDLTLRLNQYSRAFANVIAHELGHTLGLNHQPTFATYMLPDDPDNDPETEDDSNQGPGLMGYSSTYDYLNSLLELGTDVLNPSEFPVGHIDTADLLLRWLS